MKDSNKITLTLVGFAVIVNVSRLIDPAEFSELKGMTAAIITAIILIGYFIVKAIEDKEIK